MGKRMLLLVSALSLSVGCASGGKSRNPFDELKTAEQLEQVSASPSLPLKYDKTKDNWVLLEDIPFDGQSFAPELVEFLKPGEPYVNGEMMKQRAKELNAHLGQRQAEYLLEHQDLIPKEW